MAEVMVLWWIRQEDEEINGMVDVGHSRHRCVSNGEGYIVGVDGRLL